MTAYYINLNGDVRASEGVAVHSLWRPVLVVDPNDTALVHKIAFKAGAPLHLVENLVHELIRDALPVEEPIVVGSVVHARANVHGDEVRWVRVDGRTDAPWVHGAHRRSWPALINPRLE